LPPLRQRREDISELITYFLDKINRSMGTSVTGISADAQAVLLQYPWPGNIRELENVLLRASVLAPGRMLTVADLSLPQTETSVPEDVSELTLAEVVRQKLKPYFQQSSGVVPTDLYASIIEQIEKPLIELTLEYTGGNQLKAADVLGINRNTLRKKITDLKIEVKKGGGN
jgi:two-component system nitrogen regulation response regulator GlnG